MQARKKKLVVAIAMICGGAMTMGVNAQQAPAPQKVEKIEVTGSNIKRVDAEGSAPIQTITREEIEASGKQTVTDLLRNLPTNAGGGLNDITASNSFSSGASTVSLRGLGSAATLVLLNGRRIAPFGNADPNFGQSAVVNLDALPLDVVDRIEILKDGASAIYGSEAVAGVVNIILRKDYTGAQIGGFFAQNRDNDYRTWRATTTLGFGDLARDRYNVFMNYERVERDVTKVDDVENYILYTALRDSATFQTFRRFTSSFAGNYVTGIYDPVTLQATALALRPAAQQPANCAAGAIKVSGICRWDIPSKQDIVPESTRDNFFARGTVDFNAAMSGFAEAGFNRTKTFYRGSPQVYGDFGAWYSSSQQRLVNLPEFLPATHPNNPFGGPIIFRHRFSEVGDNSRLVNAEAERFVGGLKGATAGGLDWETGILYSSNETKVTQFNSIRRTPLTQGILNGTYNFLNPQAGAIKPADLRIDTVDNADSSFLIVDAKGSKEFMQLPGGSLALAAGLEFRKEERSARPDEAKVRGEVIGAGAAVAEGDRDVTSLYAELSIPFLKNIETQVAVRTDKYSDYGRSTTPKFGIKWKVIPSLAVRGSYAEGFRAPSLTEISRSSVTAFTTVTDPKRCIVGDELACLSNIAALLENANRLDPEKSKSYNVGIVWDPIKDLSLTLDYFDIRRRQEITVLDPDLILQNEDATTGVYAGRVIRGPVLPGEAAGPLQAIRTFYFNSGQTNVKGYDLDVRYNVNLGAFGKLRNNLSMTYYDSFNGNSADSEPLIETATFGFPRTRGTLRNTWDYRDWTLGLTTNYNAGYNVLRDPTLTCSAAIRAVQPSCKVASNTTYDIAVQWTGVKNLVVNFVAQNITDKKAPLDANARPVNFTYHPFRSVYYVAGFTYKFR